MKDKVGVPTFPPTKDQFDPRSLNEMQRMLSRFLNELVSPGHCDISTLKLTGLPTSSTGERNNTVYVENGYLRLSGAAGASLGFLVDTRAEIAAKNIPAVVNFIITGGYASVGDGGNALYERVVSEPSHSLKVQSSDGAWWELVPDHGRVVNARQAGAKGDNTTNDSTQLQNVLDAEYDLLIPEGTFLCAGLVPKATGQRFLGIGPKSILKQNATDTRIINDTTGGIDRVAFRNLFFQGNSTKAGAIRLENYDHIDIEGCWFDGFGDIRESNDSAKSPIHIRAAENVRVVNNISLANSVNQHGADIYLGYNVRNAIVTGNHLLSDCDAGISVALVADADTSAVHHTISNNIIVKANPNSDNTDNGRHGIVAPYGKKYARATIQGNVIVGSNWAGIYISSGNDTSDPPDNTASVVISDNAIYNVAGGSSTTTVYGGIVVTGNNGVIVKGNIIEGAGYFENGTAATNTVPGIRVVNNCRGAIISGNHIYKGAGRAIHINTLGFICENIAIVGNVMRENQEQAIEIQKDSGTGRQKNIRVAENVIDSAADEQGILLNASSGGAAVQGDIVFENNTLICTHGTPTKSGVHLAGATPDGGARVVGNHIKGYTIGIELNASLSDRAVGDTVRLDRNYIDCPTAFKLTVASGFAIVCDNEYGPSATARFSGSGARREGRRLGANASGTGLYEVYGATPTAGAWNAGERSTTIAPSAGGKIGSVCVTGGSPGTWKDYGAIDA